MNAQKKRKTKQQSLVERIEESANRQHWNECRKHLRALCKEIGRDEARRYDPGTLENALTLLELIEKTRLDEERPARIVHTLQRRLMDYLVVKSSPQSWQALQAHLEAGGFGYPLRPASHAPDGEPCYRLRDVCLAKVSDFCRNNVGIC